MGVFLVFYDYRMGAASYLSWAARAAGILRWPIEAYTVRGTRVAAGNAA